MTGDERHFDRPDGIHRVLSVRGGGACIVKIRRGAPPGFFASEARGLRALSATGSVRVPEVIAVGERGIVLQDLGRGSANDADWADAGRRLANLHRHVGDAFGFTNDGWCGDSAQDNSVTADGHAFFARHRLAAQADLAARAGLLRAADLAAVEALGTRLPAWVPPARPVLVHGDLWRGNLHVCADGGIALIDAGAVHYGWSEADLAMTTLFGEPPAPFYQAYEATAGIDGAWRTRAPLYNLYHLLNHLNLFGSAYVGAVRGVLDHYA